MIPDWKELLQPIWCFFLTQGGLFTSYSLYHSGRVSLRFILPPLSFLLDRWSLTLNYLNFSLHSNISLSSTSTCWVTLRIWFVRLLSQWHFGFNADLWLLFLRGTGAPQTLFCHKFQFQRRWEGGTRRFPGIPRARCFFGMRPPGDTRSLMLGDIPGIPAFPGHSRFSGIFPHLLGFPDFPGTPTLPDILPCPEYSHFSRTIPAPPGQGRLGELDPGEGVLGWARRASAPPLSPFCLAKLSPGKVKPLRFQT